MKIQLVIRTLTDGSVVHDVVLEEAAVGGDLPPRVTLLMRGGRGMGDRQAAERVIEVIETYVDIVRLPNAKVTD